MGIEPTPGAWEAHVLPLNYARISKNIIRRKLVLVKLLCWINLRFLIINKGIWLSIHLYNFH